MKTIAYLRVSTTNQDLDQQRLTILDYAHRHRITVDEFVSVEVSSRKGLKQRGIWDLLERMEAEDALLVSELSRLGRSLSQIIFLVDQLVRKRVRFVAIKEGIEFTGQTDLQWSRRRKTKVTVALFGLFAEIERDLISQRTKEGLAAARAKGKILGRPKGFVGKSRLDGKEAEIKWLLNKGEYGENLRHFSDGVALFHQEPKTGLKSRKSHPTRLAPGF